MTDTWSKLRMRLQSVAGNNGSCSGITLIYVNILLSNGVLAGWYKPERVPIEPRSFDVSQLMDIFQLTMEKMDSWNLLMHTLIPSDMKQQTGIVNRVLVIKEGKPVGWLDMA